MFNFQLKKYNTIFDYSIGSAEKLILAYENSNNFTLTCYRGQKEFYEEFVSLFVSQVNKYHNLVHLSLIKNEFIFEGYESLKDLQKYYKNGWKSSIENLSFDSFLNLVYKIINILFIIVKNEIKNGTLDFYVMLFCYVNILSYIHFIEEIPNLKNNITQDKYGKEDIGGFGTLTQYGEFTNNYDYSILFLWIVKENTPECDISYIGIYDFINERRNLRKNIVPFVTDSGCYGMNTFLLLFFNGLYPIGISKESYTFKNETYTKNLINISQDFRDIFKYSDIYCVSENMKENREFSKVKSEYEYILQNQDSFRVGQVEDFIVLLFEHIHECGSINLSKILQSSKKSYNNHLMKHDYAKFLLNKCELDSYKSGDICEEDDRIISSKIMSLISADYAIIMRNLFLGSQLPREYFITKV